MTARVTSFKKNKIKKVGGYGSMFLRTYWSFHAASLFPEFLILIRAVPLSTLADVYSIFGLQEHTHRPTHTRTHTGKILVNWNLLRGLFFPPQTCFPSCSCFFKSTVWLQTYLTWCLWKGHRLTIDTMSNVMPELQNSSGMHPKCPTMSRSGVKNDRRGEHLPKIPDEIKRSRRTRCGGSVIAVPSQQKDTTWFLLFGLP